MHWSSRSRRKCDRKSLPAASPRGPAKSGHPQHQALCDRNANDRSSVAIRSVRAKNQARRKPVTGVGVPLARHALACCAIES